MAVVNQRRSSGSRENPSRGALEKDTVGRAGQYQMTPVAAYMQNVELPSKLHRNLDVVELAILIGAAERFAGEVVTGSATCRNVR